MKLTKKQIREIAKRVMPTRHEELPADQQAAFLKRIKDERIESVDQSHSLHCWSEDFLIDGQKYQVIGELGNDDPPTVYKVVPNNW